MKENDLKNRLKKIEAKTIEYIKTKQNKDDCFVKKSLKKQLLEKQRNY